MAHSANPEPKLYAAREPIFPRRVRGAFRNLKWWLMAVTLGIYYLTPWIRFDRGPDLPSQAVLVDMANRRFYFFWIEIWPHEFYFIAGLLIMAGLGLFLFTASLGRVWCGYACPQTVWTDLFILVERWIEGDRNARVKLWNAPWSARKLRLRVTKWITWFVIAVLTGGAWVFYFADAPTLLRDLVTGQALPIAYLTIAVLTATTFVFGGFMREQVCIYMCPWPRIQGAMMDSETLTVGYRYWRGEPRGKHRKKEGADRLGDCIDCNACVAVCPVGIDIRDGQQMACITCALCIDACDEVMDKTGRPRGLIGYLSATDEAAEQRGRAPRRLWQHLLRPRTIVYSTLWSLIGFGLVFALFIRAPIDISVAPVRNPTYVVLSDGDIRNTYDVRLRNKRGETRDFRLSITADAPFRIMLEGTQELSVPVGADVTFLQRVYVIAPADSAAAGETGVGLRFWVEDLTNGDRAYANSVFNGKGSRQ